MSHFPEKNLQKAREALNSGDLSMPPEFFPNECYIPYSEDPWDNWESKKYCRKSEYNYEKVLRQR